MSIFEQAYIGVLTCCLIVAAMWVVVNGIYARWRRRVAGPAPVGELALTPEREEVGDDGESLVVGEIGMATAMSIEVYLRMERRKSKERGL